MPTIIWDWNGTLLNDLDLCIQSINTLLERRNLPQINGSRYKEVFSFPVKNYYKAIGFDFNKEDFAIPAREFIDLYNGKTFQCQLQKGSVEILDAFKNAGCNQYVLSAMKQNTLDKSISHFQLESYFQGIYGIEDHYAHSKIHRGKHLLFELNDQERKDAWIIGDTIHDYEVAEELNTKCILVADGHQSKERLLSTGAHVVSKLEDLPGILLS